LYNFGYDGTALLPVPIEVAADALPGSRAHVAVEAKWLVCHEECVPGKATLAIDMPIAAAATGQSRSPDPKQSEALFDKARAKQPQPADWKAQFTQSGDRLVATVRGANLPIASGVDAFAVQTRIVANAPPRVETLGSELVLTFAKSDYFTALPPRLDLVLRDGDAHAWLLHANAASAPTPP
jgi:thiol:disulfide interchange protein DsbD